MPTEIEQVIEEANSQVDDLEQEILSILNEDTSVAWRNDELAEEIGTNHQQVSRATKALRESDDNDVSAVRVGRPYFYFIDDGSSPESKKSVSSRERAEHLQAERTMA